MCKASLTSRCKEDHDTVMQASAWQDPIGTGFSDVADAELIDAVLAACAKKPLRFLEQCAATLASTLSSETVLLTVHGLEGEVIRDVPLSPVLTTVQIRSRLAELTGISVDGQRLFIFGNELSASEKPLLDMFAGGTANMFLPVVRSRPQNSSFYSGCLRDGTFEGNGLMRYQDDSIYNGNWIAGQRSGVGRYQDASGAVYEGNFRNDHCDGYGVLSLPNGDVYQGTFENYDRHEHSLVETSAVFVPVGLAHDLTFSRSDVEHRKGAHGTEEKFIYSSFVEVEEKSPSQKRDADAGKEVQAGVVRRSSRRTSCFGGLACIFESIVVSVMNEATAKISDVENNAKPHVLPRRISRTGESSLCSELWDNGCYSDSECSAVLPTRRMYLREGALVEFCGLIVSTDLNGKRGRLGPFNKAKGRWRVSIRGRKDGMFLAENLVLVDPSVSQEELVDPTTERDMYTWEELGAAKEFDLNRQSLHPVNEVQEIVAIYGNDSEANKARSCGLVNCAIEERFSRWVEPTPQDSMDDIFSFIETGHLARDLHGPTGASRTMFANIGTDDTDSEAEILHSVGTTAHGDETDERDQSQATWTSTTASPVGKHFSFFDSLPVHAKDHAFGDDNFDCCERGALPNLTSLSITSKSSPEAIEEAVLDATTAIYWSCVKASRKTTAARRGWPSLLRIYDL